MNIYIKSFNRPFYLERCIASLYLNLKGEFKIIVLDDGTLKKYIKKLQLKYGEVEFRYSNADDYKFELLRQEKFDEIKKNYIEPYKFWVNEISKEENDFFFLLEDDTWITTEINLNEIYDVIKNNNTALLMMSYAQNWWTNIELNNFRVFQNFSIQKILPRIVKPNDSYKIWAVCGAIYEKRYWLSVFSNIYRMADESTQLYNVYNYFSKNNTKNYFKLSRVIILPGFVVPARSTSEYYDAGLKQHVFLDCLNEYWFNNDTFNCLENFPLDFSENYIADILNTELNAKQVEFWSHWYSNTLKGWKYYELIQENDTIFADSKASMQLKSPNKTLNRINFELFRIKTIIKEEIRKRMNRSLYSIFRRIGTR
jgi:hypothetical protein